MKLPTDEEIAGQLVNIISDGFNRSLAALAEAGVVDTTNLKSHYSGIGNGFYDLVTEQIVLTAKLGAPMIRNLFQSRSKTQRRSIPRASKGLSKPSPVERGSV